MQRPHKDFLLFQLRPLTHPRFALVELLCIFTFMLCFFVLRARFTMQFKDGLNSILSVRMHVGWLNGIGCGSESESDRMKHETKHRKMCSKVNLFVVNYAAIWMCGGSFFFRVESQRADA